MKNSFQIKSRNKPCPCPKESLSESSFLSENFCFSILGQPCANLRKKKIVGFENGELNKNLFDNGRNFRKQRVAVYNMMREVNNEYSVKSKENLKNRSSRENIEINSSFESEKERSRNTLLSNELPEHEIDGVNSEDDQDKSISSKTSKGSKISKKETLQSLMKQNMVSQTSAVSKNTEDSQGSRNQILPKDLKNGNSGSEIIKKEATITRISVSSRNSQTLDRIGSEIYDRVRSETYSKITTPLNENNDNQQMPSILSANFDESEPPSPIRQQSERNHQSVSEDQKEYILEGADDVDETVKHSYQTYDQPHPKIRQIPKRDSRPCYCDTNSQTSYPSILKQSHYHSTTSKMDKYPVKEANTKKTRHLPKFVDKILQTSDNSIFESKSDEISNTNQIPTLDSSINTLPTDSTGIQVTELDSTKVQTIDTSTTDEICFRPIINYCKCNEIPNGLPERLSFLRCERNGTSSSNPYETRENNNPFMKTQKVKEQEIQPIDNINYSKPPMLIPNTLHEKLSPNHINRDSISSAKRNFNSTMNTSQKRVQRKFFEIENPIPTRTRNFTETSEDVTYCECPGFATSDDLYDSYEEPERLEYEYNRKVEKPQRLYYGNRSEVLQNVMNGRDKFTTSGGDCKCCTKRTNRLPTNIRKDPPNHPPLPPIEYELLSSDDDNVEINLDEDNSDEYFYFNQPDGRLTGYNDLPYQSNDQYIDLVQELEDTIQSRNKNRVQRALTEFEHKSKLNKPLEKPIIDYEETSESEEPLMKKISELAEKRRNNHKLFPCKGTACCNCIVREDQKNTLVPKSILKKNTQWQMTKTGEWYRVNPTSRRANGLYSSKRNQGCVCTCKKEHAYECTCTCNPKVNKYVF